MGGISTFVNVSTAQSITNESRGTGACVRTDSVGAGGIGITSMSTICAFINIDASSSVSTGAVLITGFTSTSKAASGIGAVGVDITVIGASGTFVYISTMGAGIVNDHFIASNA